jgi:hypothetical protein
VLAGPERLLAGLARGPKIILGFMVQVQYSPANYFSEIRNIWVSPKKLAENMFVFIGTTRFRFGI